ncbi:MAG: DedA family protein [Planctomycetes bacterium]|nr:DedA family protein [Planctomycetota bacterium]
MKVKKKRGPIRRLYDWTIHWAETRYAEWALFILAFAGSSFFPIPPDVLLITMALAAPKKSLRYAGICMLGSVLGAFLGYGIGYFFFDSVGSAIIEFYGLEEAFGSFRAHFHEQGFLYVFGAALTPIPYKVFTITSGFCGISLLVVTSASVIGRGLRFFCVGALFKFFGPKIKEFIDRYFNLMTILFLILLVGGFVFVKVLWGNHGKSTSKEEQKTEEKPRGNSTHPDESGR